MRCFIAIELSKEIKAAILGVINNLKDKGGKISWAKPQGIHLTLKFLGNIKSEFLPKIETVLKKSAKKHAPFSLNIKGTGTFPPQSYKPRIIWAGIEENKSLLSLHHELDSSLIKIGFQGEKRNFSPHITLGRIKSYNHINKLLSELSKYNKFEFGRKKVLKIILYESVLKPNGAEHTKIIEQELA